MLCSNCQKEIESNRYICPYCGSLVSSSDLAMPILETPIFMDNQAVDKSEVAALTIDANPNDFQEKQMSSPTGDDYDLTFQDVTPDSPNKANETFVDNSYTFDYKGVVSETKESQPVLNSPIVSEPSISKEVSKSMPNQEDLLKPFVMTSSTVEKNNDNLSSDNKTLENKKLEVPPSFSYNEMPISDKFLYDRKRNDEVKEEVISLNQQTVGTPSISSINDQVPRPDEDSTEKQDEETKKNHFLIEQALQKPKVVVKMPEHPRGKLPGQVATEQKRFRWLLILAIVLLLIAGSIFSYYVFLSTKSPTQYRLKDEIVPAVTTIVGNRNVKEVKVNSNETEVKRSYHYINISNVTADLTNYITYLQDSLKYINTTPYDLTESSGTVKLGCESKTAGYVILMTITYDTNSYTITVERKQGTLTRY